MIFFRFLIGIIAVAGGVRCLGAAQQFDKQGQSGLTVVCFLTSLALLAGDALVERAILVRKNRKDGE